MLKGVIAWASMSKRAGKGAGRGTGGAQASAQATVPAPPAGAECAHANVVQADGEMVCTSCGTVIDDDALAALHGCHDHNTSANASLPQTWGGDDSESKPNLYVTHVLGTANAIPKMHGMQLLSLYCKGGMETGKDRRNKTLLSKFSNACEKMQFSQTQAETAWKLFQRAAKDSSPRKMPESAAWAIYKTCQMHSIPVTADEILGVVRSNFGRKTMPNMVKILYSHMPKADDPLDGASDAGPDQQHAAQASRGAGNDQYYFALNMRRLLKGRSFSKEMYASAKSDAWRMYNEVFRTGNPNIRAKRSIAMAFGVGGS